MLDGDWSSDVCSSDLIYRNATTDWGARNSERYFGSADLGWQELPGLKLKAAAAAALQR
jgi:hypothetical protein